uniref:Cation-transporting P-type ATPase C-terminal domain-containing protein n=1 Tax=Ditylenchus dipsaci TaxID=166011 RepID=A0A915CXU0_9BILA
MYAPLFAPPTQHFTIVFNTFVMMTLFNEINSRKVHGERNVFKYLSSNHMFCVIWISTFIGQILIIQFGGKWFSTARLDANQWVVCLLLGLSELLMGQIVATIPSKKLPKSMAVLRGIPRPTKIALHRHDAQLNDGVVMQSHSTKGMSLWMRGVELIGLHYRVFRAMQENIKEKRLGQTAPHMSAEAAEKWRQSYRRYRHRKHMEKRMRSQEHTSPIENEPAGTPVSVISNGTEEQPSSPQGKLNRNAVGAMPTIIVEGVVSPSGARNHERRLHRHIRELTRPASQDGSPAGPHHHHHRHHQRSFDVSSSSANQAGADIGIPMEDFSKKGSESTRD